MSVLSLRLRRPFWRAVTTYLCGAIARLNARIDSRPTPRHHRLGSWMR